MSIDQTSHLFGPSMADAYRASIDRAAVQIASRVSTVRAPYSGAAIETLRDLVGAVDLDSPLPDADTALDEVGRLYLDHAVWFHDPGYVAHLNCPVVLPALSAEVLLSAVNSSVDTYDQSAAGTLMEQRLIRWTADRIGFPATADGVFTSGGTQSNLQGLLLAREHALASHPGPREENLARLRVLATTEAHFSVQTAAHLLGLAADAVVGVVTDDDARMDPGALIRTVDDLQAEGLIPMAVVATAGTTDLGRIDPLSAIGSVCADRGIWLHVDAAYGCGLLVSRRRRQLLAGIERADSVTVDFHKSYFQPVSSSAIVMRDGSSLSRIAHHADYLNPRTAGVPNQVDKSPQTTRRFDALKLWMTLRTVGADRLGDMFDSVVDLAARAHDIIEAADDLEAAARPSLSTVLFRYRPPGQTVVGCDPVQPAVRERLFASGRAVIGGTTLGGHHWLKFTLLNPQSTMDDIHRVLDLVRATGDRLLADRTDAHSIVEVV